MHKPELHWKKNTVLSIDSENSYLTSLYRKQELNIRSSQKKQFSPNIARLLEDPKSAKPN